jgi:predicted pyridoxine 5'-phosphate oxidase superfamily flavin-nucleotide-binding protein
MGILTEEMQRLVRRIRLGYVATVCPDGTPNLSPKGTTTVWDDDHLVFADLHSPNTVANLRHNPMVEINVVDPLVRKGYRFKGPAQVLTEGDLYEQIIAFYEQRGTQRQRIHAVVLVAVERARPLISPAYDRGVSEDEVRQQWESYYNSHKS